MLRPALLLVVVVFALQGAHAQQVQSHGAPASVLSPTSPGTAHGAPASVNSPTSPQGRPVFVDSRRFRVRFGSPNPRGRRTRRDVVPVPIFIPAYPLNGDYAYSEADPATADQGAPSEAGADSSDADTDALQQAYNQGAHDALAQQRANSRYGEHYLDSREKGQPAPRASKDRAPQSDAGARPEPADDSPATIFIFKDGQKLQTQNYAILGQTLFDFSNNQLRKIKLAELDLDATKKANEDLGITLKLPSSP
ncbi:MAG TPA: hypothetical protein VKY85_03415 [Candidatus Angelobacter sp.]|nr:hypothetical protein [Candidatus Angelobacter sp.]